MLKNKKIVLFSSLAVVLIIAGGLFLFLKQKPTSTENVTSLQEEKISTPSKTLKTHTDPSGFSFDYPDNLSLSNNETDDNTYADIVLTAKDINGSLRIKVVDTKFTSIDTWAKENTKVAQKEKSVKLGTFNASELKNSTKILTGAIDQGILFTVEALFEGQEIYWTTVYEKILSSFTFVTTQPEVNTSQGSNISEDEVYFEGEEVVE